MILILSSAEETVERRTKDPPTGILGLRPDVDAHCQATVRRLNENSKKMKEKLGDDWPSLRPDQRLFQYWCAKVLKKIEQKSKHRGL